MKILSLILILSGCVSAPIQKLNPSIYYKNDICFTYDRDTGKVGSKGKWIRNGKRRKFVKQNKMEKITFCGVGVLPEQDVYKLKITHHSKLNFFAMNTCHREVTTENPDKGIFKKNGVISIDYIPTFEKDKACPLFVAAYSRNGKHGWGIAVFESKRFTLPAKILCNGDNIETVGVSICEAKMGLIQKIIFANEVIQLDPVKGASDRKKPCPKMETSNQKDFEFIMPPRECIYGFIDKKTKQLYKFYTVGYEALIVRED